MPQMQTIELLAQTSPIVVSEVELEPVRMNGNVAVFTDYSVSTPRLRDILTISLDSPSKTSKLHKARFKLMQNREKMDGETGTGTVDCTCSVDVTFLLPENSVTEDRAKLIGRLGQLLTEGTIEDMVTNLRPLY